jgi:hypothetical protein
VFVRTPATLSNRHSNFSAPDTCRCRVLPTVGVGAPVACALVICAFFLCFFLCVYETEKRWTQMMCDGVRRFVHLSCKYSVSLVCVCMCVHFRLQFVSLL